MSVFRNDELSRAFDAALAEISAPRHGWDLKATIVTPSEIGELMRKTVIMTYRPWGNRPSAFDNLRRHFAN